MSWSTTKFTLQLKCKIDVDKYNNQSYILPPKELGICKNWRFEALNNNESMFFAIWDLRQINRSINTDTITEKISDFIIPEQMSFSNP
jgi:hypothetical protein|tara:strand:- start:1391 stop:1654 length:264 start_codon:yes stop_codon:yes gene_type:complete